MHSTKRKFGLAAIVFAMGLFAFAAAPAVAQETGGGKPSFAGKPDEKLGKGGRSAAAKEHAKGQMKKEEEELKEKKTKKEKKVKNK